MLQMVDPIAPKSHRAPVAEPAALLSAARSQAFRHAVLFIRARRFSSEASGSRLCLNTNGLVDQHVFSKRRFCRNNNRNQFAALERQLSMLSSREGGALLELATSQICCLSCEKSRFIIISPSFDQTAFSAHDRKSTDHPLREEIMSLNEVRGASSDTGNASNSDSTRDLPSKSEIDFRKVFESAPALFLLLGADETFPILAASDGISPRDLYRTRCNCWPAALRDLSG